MIQIPSPQTPSEFSEPSLSQTMRFFSQKQRKILIISSVVFFAILVLSGAAFYFWLTSFKKSLVDFTISGPGQVVSGEAGAFTISYWNNTNQILQSAVLNIRYPQDAVIDGDKVFQNIDLGTIGIGGGGKQEITVAFIGPDKSIRKLEAVLTYKPQNTSSSFENSAFKEVAISGSALGIDFKTPDTVLPNVRGVYTIHYKNNTGKLFQNASIQISYPSGFRFVSSDRAPSKDDNTWNLGDLNPNEEGDIAIVGVFGAASNTNFDLAIGVFENGNFYKFSQISSQINLMPLPLKLNISVNGKPDLLVNAGDSLRFKIHYQNDAGIALSDVILKVKLDGLMFDFSSLETNGYFGGAENIITWNGGNFPDFKNLQPNASGDAEFNISVKSRHIVRTFRDKNFLLQVSAEMDTPTVPPSLAVRSLSVTSDLALKVNTKVELGNKGYYFDSAIKNSGPLPPKVNQATTYTTHWQIVNYSNDVNNVIVKAVLPQGVGWLNKKIGAGAAVLEYDKRTSELVWNVGEVAAGTGVLLNPYEVIFQVSLTPAANQANMIAPILNAPVLTGNDIFTGNSISITAPALKTDLPDDSGVGYSKSRIQP